MPRVSDITQLADSLPPVEKRQRSTYTRSEFERERDMVEEARLYLRGTPVREIQSVVEKQYPDRRLHKMSIYNDLKEIQSRWIQSSLMDFNEHKARELARIDQLESEYWKEYERSKQEFAKEESESSEDMVAFSASDGGVVPIQRSRHKKTTETRLGSKTYLEGVQWCIEARCKILGLFTPERFAVDWRIEARKIGWPEQLTNQIYGNMVDLLASEIARHTKPPQAGKDEIVDAEFTEAKDVS
jgi:hypothetical protein